MLKTLETVQGTQSISGSATPDYITTIHWDNLHSGNSSYVHTTSLQTQCYTDIECSVMTLNHIKLELQQCAEGNSISRCQICSYRVYLLLSLKYKLCQLSSK